MEIYRTDKFRLLIFFIVLTAMLHVSLIHSYAACIPSPAGLVSWWKAEGNANDQTTTNDGSFSSATYATGNVGQAFSFDGTNQFQAATTGFPTGGADRSMAMWVNISQLPAAGNYSHFAGYGTNATGELYIVGTYSSGKLYFSNGGGVVWGPTLQTNRWYHVAVTNSGTMITLYVDGTALTPAPAIPRSTIATTNETFTAGYLDSTRKLNGYLDEIQVYDHALTAAEIQAIYDAGANGLCYSLNLSPATLPDGAWLDAYSQAITIANGTGPYLYSITAGALPPGLALAANGTLSGTPTTPGTFNFTVSATDSISGNGSNSYSITIPVPVSSANPPFVGAPAATKNTKPFWVWAPGGGGIGIFRYQMGSESPGGWSLESTVEYYTPANALTEGAYVLYVQEKDSKDLWSSSGSRTVIVDTTPPDTVIDSATPFSPVINSEYFSTISIFFSAPGETGPSFECRYDNGSFATCSSPAVYNLITGGHTLEVRAIDSAGNVDPTPAVYQWSVVGKMVGAAYSWGLNRNGTLGNGAKDNLPHTIANKVNGPIEFTQMAGNEAVTFAVRTDGTLWWWGGGGDVTTPAEVTTISGVKQVTAGSTVVYALKFDGSVWSLADISTPRMTPLFDVIKIESEGDHVLALKSDGTIWAWGSNAYGQLGNGTQDSSNSASPTQVLQNDGALFSGVVALATGTFSSYALKSDGTVWAWGKGLASGLGITDPNTNILFPTQVTLPGNPVIKDIAGGSYHAIALDSSGNVWAWGDNEWGQTGSSDTQNWTYTPVQVPAFAYITAIAAGGPNSLALSTAKTVWSWGRNDKGQLGTGTYDYVAHPTPAKVAYLSGIEQIAVSSGWTSVTSMALKSAWVTMSVDAAETSSIQHPSNRVTSLALDPQDKVHIAYVKNAQPGMVALEYINNVSGTWVDRGTLAVIPDVNQSAIAVDSQGTAHFSYSYYDLGISSNRLMYARYTGNGFEQTSLDTNGYYNSIVTDPGNKVHICYSSGNDLKYATNESGQWVTVVVNPGAITTAYCSIAYSLPPALIQGISVAYQRDSTLWVSTKNQLSGVWGHTQVDNTVYSGVWPSLAFDVFGQPYVSYAVGSDWKQTSSQLKFAAKGPHGWTKYFIDNLETRTGLYSTLSVKKVDNASLKSATISYFDAVNMDLKVATVDYGTLWKSSISTVDTDGYVGEYTSIALDSKGIAHISYFSYEPLEGLKYATNSDSTGPTGSIFIKNGSVYSTTADIAVVLTCDDTFGIGCWRMQFSHDGLNWSEYNPETFAAAKTWSLLSGDGSKKIYARFEDAANNWSGVYYANIFLDTVKPTGTLGINATSGFTNNRLILLNTSCSDAGGAAASGCYQMRFSTDGVIYSTAIPYATESSVFLPNNDGLKDVYVIYIDRAGNESIPVHATVTLDKSTPATTASPPGPEGVKQTNSVSVTLSCADGSGSGCASTYYSIDNGITTLYSTPINISGITSPVILTYYSIDKLGNRESTKSENYVFAAGVTVLTLDAPPTALQNKPLEVSGKMTRLPDSGAHPNNDMNLIGLPITLTITGPPGSSCSSGCTITQTVDDLGHLQPILTYSSLGHYKVKGINVFDYSGSYTLTAHFAGTGLHQVVDSTPEPITVGISAGYAIIVEGKVSSNEGLASHNKTANRIYTTLLERGFDANNIKYFNYGGTVPKKGTSANDANSIWWAIETWAKASMNGAPAPLYVIFVDHGNKDTFFIYPDTLTPTELNNWFGNLEAGLVDAAKLQKRVVILGACYSGSFIDTLKQAPVPGTNAGRIVISSAAADEQSYKGPNEPDGIRSGEFFLEELFKSLKKGSTIKAAFVEATAQTRSFTSQGGGSANSTNGYNDTAVQHPLLNDSGSGSGSNTIGDGIGDGIEADKILLGVGVTNASLGLAEIKSISATQYLSSSQEQQLLELEAYGNSEVSSAWFEIKAPGAPLKVGTPTQSFQLDLDLPRWAMTLNISTGKWQAAYGSDSANRPTEKFGTPGKYEVFYFTKSTSDEISEMHRSLVYKNKPDNTAPANFDLTSPVESDDPLHPTEVWTAFNMVWEPSSDPDGLTYTVQIATDTAFSDNSIIFQKEEIQDNWYYVDESAALNDGSDYYWRVIAVDSYGNKTTSSHQWGFHTNDTNFPSLCRITGTVGGVTPSPPMEFGVTAKQSGVTVAQTSTFSGGNYFFNLTPGSYTLNAAATGFSGTNKSVSTVTCPAAPIPMLTVADTGKPLITAFAIPFTAAGTAVNITTLTATDNVVGTLEFCVAENSSTAGCSWGAAPVQHTFSGIPVGVATPRTLYAFVRDVAGNISVVAVASTTITLPPKLQVSVTGNGRVYNNESAGIDCSSSNPATSGCNETVTSGTTYSLIATTNDWRYLFASWSGSFCNGSSTPVCDFTLAADAALTADFTQKKLVKLSSGAEYASLQDALDHAQNETTVQALADYFQEPLLFNRLDTEIRIDGGWDDSSYSSKSKLEFTIVKDRITIRQGTLKVRGPLAVR